MELRFKRPKKSERHPQNVPVREFLDEPTPETERPVITDLANFLRRTETLLPVAVVGIFLMGLVGFLYWAKPFFLPLLLALTLSFLLRPVVKSLTRLGISQIFGSIFVLVAFSLAVGVIVSHLVQPATQWAARAPDDLRRIEDRIQRLVRPATQLSRAAEQVGDLTEDTAGPPSAPKVEVKENNVRKIIFDYASSFVTMALETVVLLFFFLGLGDTFTQKLIRILPTLNNKKKALEISGEVQHNISIFLFTITCINVCFGALVGFSMMLLGLPNPLLWGATAAVLNFIPYFGPWMGILILGVAGLVTFESLAHAVLPPVIYLGLHAVESNFLTPLILGRRLTMNPVVIFLALMFWMWLWGIPGALLSVPLLMMFKVLCDHFKPLAPIGEFISGTEKASV